MVFYSLLEESWSYFFSSILRFQENARQILSLAHYVCMQCSNHQHAITHHTATVRHIVQSICGFRNIVVALAQKLRRMMCLPMQHVL